MTREKVPPRISGIASMRRALLRWYAQTRRKLPWREAPSPYRTWVSEIMLQQTQVATVLPYYARFLKRFPDLSTLADAPVEEVLRHWAGLGYYSRARNLHRAARELVADRGGRIPDTADGLRELPGIGRYTAAAIASIAFEKPHAVVDGNVIRVYSRLFALRGDPRSAAQTRRVWHLAQTHLDTGQPGDFNQAVMELGATVCLPQPDAPRCGQCPLARRCRARRLGLQERLPRPTIKEAPVGLRWTALWIEKGPTVLIWKRSEMERFLPGHWGLPEARHLPGAKTGALSRVVRHSITHHRIVLKVQEASWQSEAIPPSARWVRRKDLARWLVSSLFRKAAGLAPGVGVEKV